MRERAIGVVAGLMLLIVFTGRNDVRRIISARLEERKVATDGTRANDAGGDSGQTTDGGPRHKAATTNADIRRHQIEDGEDPDASSQPFRSPLNVRAVRTRLLRGRWRGD